MIEKEFVPYEQALALKELGFDKVCFGHYLMGKFYLKEYHKQGNRVILRPTFSQAFRWFREKYKMFGHVLSIGERNYEWRIQNIKKLQHKRYFTLADVDGGQLNNTYEKAELECLKKLIEIIKQNP